PWSTLVTKHLASTDIEAVGRYQAGDNGKFAKQIVGHQKQIGTAGAAWGHAYLHGMLLIDGSQEPHMDGNLWGRKRCKILGIELGKQLVNDLWWDVWTPLRHILAQGLVVGQRRGLTGTPHGYSPLSVGATGGAGGQGMAPVRS